MKESAIRSLLDRLMLLDFVLHETHKEGMDKEFHIIEETRNNIVELLVEKLDPYISTGILECLHCKSEDLQYQMPVIVLHTGEQLVKCNTCGKSWVNVYKLVENRDGGQEE